MKDGSYYSNDSNMDASPSPCPSYQVNPRPSGSTPVNTAPQSPFHGRGSDQYGGVTGGGYGYVSCQPALFPQPAYLPAFRNAGEGSVPRPMGMPRPLPAQSPARSIIPPALSPMTIRRGPHMQSYMSTPPMQAFTGAEKRCGSLPHGIMALLSPRQPPSSPFGYNIPPAPTPRTPRPCSSHQGQYDGYRHSDQYTGERSGRCVSLQPEPSRPPTYISTTPIPTRITSENRYAPLPYSISPKHPPQSPAGYNIPPAPTPRTPRPCSTHQGQYDGYRHSDQYAGESSGRYVSLQPGPSQPPNYISTTPIPAFITAKNKCAPSPYSISPNHPPQSPAGYNIPPVSARSTPLPGPFPQGPFHGGENSGIGMPAISTWKKPRLDDSKPNVHTPLPIAIDQAQRRDDDKDDVVFICSVDRARSGRKCRPRVEAISPTLPEPLNNEPLLRAKKDRRIQKLEGLIGRMETHLAELRQRRVELKEAITPPLEDPAVARKAEKHSQFLAIYAENKKKALEADELMRNLWLKGDLPFPSDKEPSETVVNHDNEKKYTTGISKVCLFIKKKREKEKLAKKTGEKFVFPEPRKQGEDKDKFSKG